MTWLVRKLRWWFCVWWDYFRPESCWAKNCLWGLGYEGEELSYKAPTCMAEAKDPSCNYTCWCGKFMDEEIWRKWRAEQEAKQQDRPLRRF